MLGARLKGTHPNEPRETPSGIASIFSIIMSHRGWVALPKGSFKAFHGPQEPSVDLDNSTGIEGQGTGGWDSGSEDSHL